VPATNGTRLPEPDPPGEVSAVEAGPGAEVMAAPAAKRKRRFGIFSRSG
jgi:hypothetical protein